MILDTVRNARISTRVNKQVKDVASKKLAAYGLTISDVVNMVLTTAANSNVPDYLQVPNQKTVKNIISSFRQLKKASKGDKSVPVAKNYKEAMRLLTK